MRNVSTLILLGTSLVATACTNSGNTASTASTDPDSPAAALDSEQSTEAEGNLMMASVDGANMSGVTPDVSGVTSLTVAQIVQAISANAAARWNPAGCATVASSGDSVSITYADCSGPHGLVHVTGQLDLTIAITPGSEIQVTAAASGLQVNGATLDINASANYQVSATAHTLTVATDGTGTGPRGADIDHKGNYTVSWDPSTQCGSIDGSWSTDFSNGSASAVRSNDVDLSRCAAGCPTGTVTHDFLGGQTLTVTFNGTNEASWATSGGKSGSIALGCQ